MWNTVVGMNKIVLFDLLKTEAQKLVGNLSSLDRFSDKEKGKEKIRANLITINELFKCLDEKEVKK